MAQLVALMSGVVLGGVAEVVGSNLARGKLFTASIGSVDSLYPSVFTYCLNLHQFLILCSSKAMMFVKLYFRTSDIYLISLESAQLIHYIPPYIYIYKHKRLYLHRSLSCFSFTPLSFYS